MGLYGEIYIKDVTDAHTWLKEWYDALEAKMKDINENSPFKYYLGLEYKYGSKEQQYCYAMVDKKYYSGKNFSYDDLIDIATDELAAYALLWINPCIPSIPYRILAHIGLFEGDELLYEIPNVWLKGKSLESEENYDSDNKFIDVGSGSKEIIRDIPHDVVNKIEKKSVECRIISACFPYGLYEIPDNTTKQIPINVEDDDYNELDISDDGEE